MKLTHLSDLHLGKHVNGFSMLEDQKYIIIKILNIIDDEKPSGVIIAGDIYDKSIPPTEAVLLFDNFLFELSKRNMKVFIIGGNHDSSERLSFASRLISNSGIYISPVYNGNAITVKLEDEYGELEVFLLPFIKPTIIKSVFQDEGINTYTDAVRIAIEHMSINPQSRNIIVTHQFVTGSETCESEEISIGGTDNVDCSVFEPFDYVALGHLHGPQSVKRNAVRYCGTPLKYSFSEVHHNKSVTVIELKEKGNIKINAVSLTPKRDLVEIKGRYNELALKEYYSKLNTDDYYHITLTDEEDIPFAIGRLRAIYPNIMKLDYDNKRTRSDSVLAIEKNIEQKTPDELFYQFYEAQNGSTVSEQQKSYIGELIKSIWEV